MQIGRFLDHTPEVASNMKIKRVAAISVNTLLPHSIAEFLRIDNEINGYTFLAGTNKNQDM